MAPDVPPVSQPWDRRPDEGDSPWVLFRAYLHSIHRDLRKISAETGAHYKTVRNYSSKWDWAERARAFDEAMAERMDEVVMSRAEQLAEEHLNHWAALRGLGMSEIARLVNASVKLGKEGAPGLLTARAALSMVKEATHYERLIVGEATERSEMKGELDLGKLSTDELRTLSALHRKAARGEK